MFKLNNLSKLVKRLGSRYNIRPKRTLLSSSPFNSLKADVQRKFDIGTHVAGFNVTEVREIPELQLVAVRLEHAKTGAQYLHIARDDTNNVFCIGFRTTPMDSTGVPHILEHNVLCGSQKYPCRDPFFKMINRSLATFMNAMTGNDYTIYPFSTQNAVDYRNLMSVYLDAVYKPNLAELDFLQEGWRLEHEDPANKESPIVLKGVVFNEMKGVFADAHQMFIQKLQNSVLPSHTYGYVSGGDPLEIPKLSWEKLKEFHAKHYHPSNSHIFSYGDLPFEDHLSYIDSEYLSKFEKISPSMSVPEEPRWTEARRAHIGCNVDPMIPQETQTTLAVSYLLTSINNQFESFVLAILGELLTSGPNAPFYKTLIESQLGTSFSPSAGFDSQTRTSTFTVGLQGMNTSKIGEVEKAIERTFSSVADKGFSEDRIESVLHNIELGLKHQTSTFGLALAMNLTPLWNHDADIIDALSINAKIDKFRKTLKEDPLFLQKKVKQYFLSNAHKLTLSMSPEDNYEQKIIEAEQNLLEKRLQNLTAEDKAGIWDLGHTLKSKQEMKEDISYLPTLKISDIPRTVPSTAVNALNLCGNVPLQVCLQPTNEVTYFNAVLSTKNLREDLAGMVPLFCSILTSMGAGDLDFREFSQRSELISGGLNSDFHLCSHPENTSRYEEGILISSYCLNKNLSPMLDLWLKVLNELRMDDVSRFTTLVKMVATSKANSLVHSGHSYAMSSASASTSFVSMRKEQVSGLTYLQYLKDLSVADDLSDVLNKVREIAGILLNKNNMRVALNTSSDNSEDDVKQVERFLKNLSGSHCGEDSVMSIPQSFTPCAQRIHHVLPFPVNFSSKSFSQVPYTHPDSGTLRVLARLMFQFLHREIREKGGAYGGGASSSPGGPFVFYSYRDPHSTRTLQTFDDAVDWVLTKEFTQQDVDEAKLGVFQSVDSPVPPGSKGMQLFLSRVTDDMFRAHRLSILESNSDDLIRVCREHLKESCLGGACLIGPQNDEIDKDPSWKVVSH